MTPIERYDKKTGHLVERKSWVPIVSVCASLSVGAFAYLGAFSGSNLGAGADAIVEAAGGGGGDSIAVPFATDWSSGTCSGGNGSDECITNGFQFANGRGNFPTPDIFRVEPGDSPVVSPWTTARPGTSGKVARGASDSTAGGGIDSYVITGDIFATHWMRIFILIEDSTQFSNHPLSYKNLSYGPGGFEMVPAGWGSEVPDPVIQDSFLIRMGNDGTLGGTNAFSGTDGVGYQKLGIVDTWYCVQWETRTYPNGGSARRIVLPYWMKRTASSWSVLDTIVTPDKMLAENSINTTLAEMVASVDSMNISDEIDTINARGVQIAQEGPGSPSGYANPDRRAAFWLAEFAISYEGHIPCDQITTNIGTGT